MAFFKGRTMNFARAFSIVCCFTLIILAEPTTQTVDLQAWCITPTINPNPARHAEFRERAKAKNIQLVFLGDSITDAWRSPDRGLKVWEKHYAPLNAANFGISAETTADTLGHIEGGLLDGLNPKVVVLLIGTNNLGGGVHSDWIAAGVEKIVKAVRGRLPNTRVLVLGIFPRGNATNEFRWRIKQVNGFLSKLDDGDHVRFLDIGEKFVDDKGEYLEGLFPDNLHPTTHGYEIWSDAMQPLVEEMMGKV